MIIVSSKFFINVFHQINFHNGVYVKEFCLEVEKSFLRWTFDIYTRN